MKPVPSHLHAPDRSFDGGDLDCGGGLLLLIRRHIDPLSSGSLLEIRSTESSVAEDLPSWCRMTGNELVSWTRDGARQSFLVSKGAFDPAARRTRSGGELDARFEVVQVEIPDQLPEPAPAPTIEPLSVMGVGSWPRPRWLLGAIHAHLTGELPEDEFQATADDAVRLAVAAQERAGVDVVSDGEQRRDGYASFVGGILDNVQLIPLADLTSMVDQPDEFAAELRALDVPAGDVRHPVVYGPLGRRDPLTVGELQFVQGLTERPVKVALPGPYLLTRTMWLDCLRDRPYETREDLAVDVVRVLREELHALLAAGAALVQFDEPVLTEVVFSGSVSKRSFMCGALSEKGDPADELAFARDLLNAVVDGLPRDRTALHVCRGNWTRDEQALLAGDYRALHEHLQSVRVGTVFLEFSTPRAGEIDVLAALDPGKRLGLGVLNPRQDRVETVEEILTTARHAVDLLGADRLLLNSDCGFATFADNPVASAQVAEAKLAVAAEAARRLRGG